MSSQRAEHWSRRRFLGELTVAGTTGLLGLGSGQLASRLLRTQFAAAAEPPPETTRIRLGRNPGSAACLAPKYYAEQFLRDEGFTDVRYVPWTLDALTAEKLDMAMDTPGAEIVSVDEGVPYVLLAGVHVGCFELFGTDRIRTIGDLKGKTVAAGPMGWGPQLFLASMMAYVGLDPRKDVRWSTQPSAEAMQLFAEGKIDGFLGFPPEPQELRARKIGHVLVNTMMDRPWSQYFCCLLEARREFVRKYPVATKRAVRAILKAADVCAQEPEKVARFLVDRGYVKRYDYALDALRHIPYDKWRDYNPEDSVRFYALRLHEVGLIKNSPQKIIAQGTDWRFLNELKGELKRSNLDPLDHLGHLAHRHPGG